MKIKQIVFLIILAMIIAFGVTNVYAASTSLSATSNSVTKGESVNINISFTAAAWNLTVSGDKISTESYASQTSDLSEAVTSKTITMDTSTSGTYKVTLSGDITDANGTTTAVSKTVTVTVKDPEPTTPTTPITPTTPTVTEPNFTSTNKTMYATGNINLRSSWSTSSSATSIKEGTELTVTATSTEKVNGYVWYRVSYNGQTKYVASSLLTNTKPEEKSNNANLKSLTVEGQTLAPTFNTETTSYTIQVASDITKLDIKAQAEDEKANVTIQGNEELKEGENTVTISVSAEDGTTKIYKIKVTKLDAIPLGLKTLAIKDTDITNMFKTDVYEYEIYVKDVDLLEIEATANEENATIEILGNENLQEGENTITIIVKSQDGEKTVTYQIKATKILTIEQPSQNKTIDSKIFIYGGIAVVLLVILVIVIIYTIKNRKKDEEYDYSDNFEGFPEELPERQANIENEIPQEQNNNIKQDYEQEEDYYVEEQNEEQAQNYYDEEQNEEQDRKSKIDYFFDNQEDDDEKTKHKRGKHF